jgi:hypothetical protein
MSTDTQTTREQEVRSTEERPRDWTPPDKLQAPTPPDGWSLRFVRSRVRNEDDSENVVERRRQGYEVVTPEEIKTWGDGNFIYTHMEDASDRGRSGEVRVGDLILMKIPTRMALQRKDHYEHTTQNLMRAVEAELRGEGSSLAPVPASESRSSVSFGTGLSGNADAHPVRFQD